MPLRWLRPGAALTIALAGCVSITGPGCENPPPSNRDPSVVSLSGVSGLTVGQTTTLECIVTDPDSDELTCQWTCTGGTLAPASGTAVEWTAPVHSGQETIEVTASDGRGGSAMRRKTIRVWRDEATLIDWFGTVYAGQYVWWSRDLIAGYTLSGQFWVDHHDIAFLILREADFDNWRDYRSYTALVDSPPSTGAAFSLTVQTPGIYFFVLDNRFSEQIDKFGHVQAYQTSP
jgi:hypothetical protein